MKRVLVVDDERDIRLLLKETLAMEGYETDLAADGAEAVRLLENGPDLILLDIWTDTRCAGTYAPAQTRRLSFCPPGWKRRTVLWA